MSNFLIEYQKLRVPQRPLIFRVAQRTLTRAIDLGALSFSLLFLWALKEKVTRQEAKTGRKGSFRTHELAHRLHLCAPITGLIRRLQFLSMTADSVVILRGHRER